VPLSRRFRVPADERRGDNGVFWYGFDLVSRLFCRECRRERVTNVQPHATILVLSLEHDFTVGSRQRAWLQQRVTGIGSERLLFVVGHRPFYNPVVAADDAVVGEHMVSELESILVDAGVSVCVEAMEMTFRRQADLFVGGHYHSYSRQCRMYRGKCVSDDEPGILHVTSGA
jgi:hypothetical protein